MISTDLNKSLLIEKCRKNLPGKYDFWFRSLLVSLCSASFFYFLFSSTHGWFLNCWTRDRVFLDNLAAIVNILHFFQTFLSNDLFHKTCLDLFLLKNGQHIKRLLKRFEINFTYYKHTNEVKSLAGGSSALITSYERINTDWYDMHEEV